jgi:hypothetical protein
MRFNPPPNWPQPPAGWTPPTDWKPDPSWPRPPSGWQLWVGEDEFVIAPDRTAVLRTVPSQPTQPWYQQTASVVLLLIFFFPVGMVLLWLRQDWSVRRRGTVTAVVGVIALFVLVGVTASPPTTPTALNTTTVAGTASPSHTSAASPSAVRSSAAPSKAPPPVATTSRAPVTSAPPKTVAPAPVHTTAAYVPPPAPVHTTQAVQAPPPPTTEQAQSCYPLTNGGNCYKPGEYCRDSDHGTTGVDAEGGHITCEDNDGWRWENS